MESVTSTSLSPIERITARNAMIFSGEIPLFPDEWEKIRFFGYGALAAASLVVVINLLTWRK